MIDVVWTQFAPGIGVYEGFQIAVYDRWSNLGIRRSACDRRRRRLSEGEWGAGIWDITTYPLFFKIGTTYCPKHRKLPGVEKAIAQYSGKQEQVVITRLNLYNDSVAAEGTCSSVIV